MKTGKASGEQTALRGLLTELKSARREAFSEPGGRIMAPKGKGVYIIYSPGGKVLHVGSTPRAKGGLAQRLRDHLAGRSSFTKKKFSGDGSKLRKKPYKFGLRVVHNPRHRALLEALAIGLLCPEHIGHGPD